MKTGIWLLTWLLISPCIVPAVAQDTVSVRATKVEAAFRTWAHGLGIKRYSIAVGYDGRVVHQAAERQTFSAPAPLASLSKAITGACILALEQKGRLAVSDTLSRLLGADHPFLTGNAKASAITLSQLLTHSSGLSPDVTQGRMHNWKFARTNRTTKRAKEALAITATKGTPGTFSYNNGNYAVLGALVEHVTGKSYETACAEVLPIIASSTSIKLDEKWRALGAFGGWQASTSDFLSFVLGQYGPQSSVQTGPWSLPSKDVGGGAFYGAGTFFRKNAKRGHNVWHSGLLCNPDPSDDLGSFFAVWGTVWSAAVTYNKCTTFRQLIALDNALWKAALK